MNIKTLSKIFSIVVCAAFVMSCQPRQPQEKERNDVYSNMLSSEKLRVGYIAYPPSFMIDPNTKTFSGISHDVLQKVATNLGIQLEYVEEVGWGSMIEAIESGRVDIVSTAVWPTAARGKRADFITPIYFSAVKAYVRKDDNRFDGNLRAANNPNIVIAAMDGEMSSIIAENDYPKASVSSVPQLGSVSQLLLDIQAGKADITFLEPAIALEFIEKNPGTIKEVVGIDAVRKFPNSFMIGKGEYRLKSTLDTAVGELHGSGAISKIINNYEKFPGSFEKITIN